MKTGIMVSDGVDRLRNIDLAQIHALGFSAVFVACYEDEVRWRAEDLATFVRRIHQAGMEPYAVPWGYGKFIDPDPSIESLFVRTHLDACQVDSRGRRILRACPNNPVFLEWFATSMRTLAFLLEAKGFFWDEPTFQFARGAWSCRCQYCRRLFRSTYGHEMPHELTDEILEMRRQSVMMFVLSAAAAIQSVDRKLQSMVMPSPRMGTGPWYNGTQDLQPLVNCSGVDALCMLVPWQEMGWDMEWGVREAIATFGKVAQAQQKACLLWLQAEARQIDRVAESVEFAARSGADAVVLSDYDSLLRTTGFRQQKERLMEALHRAGDPSSADYILTR